MNPLNLSKALAIAVLLCLSPGLTAAQEAQVSTPPVMTVDINTADAETLARVLDGVGLTRAREIIAYRELHGKFRTAEELSEVSGIGMATVERNRARIIVSGD